MVLIHDESVDRLNGTSGFHCHTFPRVCNRISYGLQGVMGPGYSCRSLRRTNGLERRREVTLHRPPEISKTD
ncbi:hypothetical protein E2C01_073800 [Portunus trituberculatus]|uniref:Uncharacterized protein n=1 Tax=Portunus trituberculatus TaxID=210409 RepID=A0A5B7IAF6_PORTR|nr:hypothetical protein [Portunus trituberculatus]